TTSRMRRAMAAGEFLRVAGAAAFADFASALERAGTGYGRGGGGAADRGNLCGAPRGTRGGDETGAARERATPVRRATRVAPYFMCLLASLVISNIETCFLPLKTFPILASALIIRRFFLSCSLCFLMYCQSFFVIWVRGIGFMPTTAPSAASGFIGFMNAAFGFLFVFFFAFFLAIDALSGW